MMTRKEQHDALMLFTSRCHEILEANMHKGGWDLCDPGRLMRRVREEMIEVELELERAGTPEFSLESLERECADVANMIMMVHDRIRRGSE